MKNELTSAGTESTISKHSVKEENSCHKVCPAERKRWEHKENVKMHRESNQKTQVPEMPNRFAKTKTGEEIFKGTTEKKFLQRMISLPTESIH